MKEEFYVYLTTNLINGKQYVGDHKTYFIESDPYLGSGKELKLDIKKFGKNHFKKEILEVFNTREESFIAQKKYILKFNTMYPNGYNLSISGGIFMSHEVSDETKKKMSRAKLGKICSKEHCDNISKGKKGKKPSEETKIKMKKPHRKFSEETRKRMSEAKKGKPSNHKKHNLKINEILT